jgi:hypothetical protein
MEVSFPLDGPPVDIENAVAAFVFDPIFEKENAFVCFIVGVARNMIKAAWLKIFGNKLT